jgi:hypothetical protein
MAPRQGIVVRPYRPVDRDQEILLAPRLVEGTAPWRDPEGTLRAVEVCLTPDTGAGNHAARGLYRVLGEEEGIRLAKRSRTRKAP